MRELLAFFFFTCGCYLLGCLSAGYYLVLFIASKDIRQTGSKSTGATNVSRVLGKKGFVLTLLIDVLKGVSIAFFCKILQLNNGQSLFSMIALLCGHIWPIQLQFKGGKGIAVLLGFFVIWNMEWVVINVTIGFLCFLWMKNFTIAGLCGLFILPIMGLINQYDAIEILLTFITIGIIYIAHRNNIMEYINTVKNGE
jgi:glycerol-3-phosphate acyltransferase PlsY